tara:strand:+ start:220 stop:426 length:207 start_codon:yes stop_codon:yes gene_type:complete
MEGKVKHYANRAKGDLDWVEWLRNLLEYLDHHKIPRINLLHPEHKTEEEVRLAKNKKARLARAKKNKK